MQQVREEARIQWDSIKGILEDRLNNSLSVAEGASGLEAASCNCAFRIEEINIETLDTNPNFGIAFISSAPCPYSCIYYTVEYFSSENLCGDNPCGDNWIPFPPDGLRNFNCPVPAYSFFPVYASFLTEDPICNANDNLPDWSITFRVYCQDSEPLYSCGLGGGYGYVSDPITFSAATSSNENGYSQFATFKLSDWAASRL